VKKNGCPENHQIDWDTKRRIKIINIVAVDDVTYEALKSITEERADVGTTQVEQMAQGHGI